MYSVCAAGPDEEDEVQEKRLLRCAFLQHPDPLFTNEFSFSTFILFLSSSGRRQKDQFWLTHCLQYRLQVRDGPGERRESIPPHPHIISSSSFYSCFTCDQHQMVQILSSQK
jgi:hypothetical protein